MQEFPPFQPTADGSTECGFPQGEGAAGKQPPLTTGFAELPEDATEGTTDTATDEELLPYMARVFGPAANCSGMLIAPGYLLTSGWCMWRVSEGWVGLVYLAAGVGVAQWLDGTLWGGELRQLRHGGQVNCIRAASIDVIVPMHAPCFFNSLCAGREGAA